MQSSTTDCIYQRWYLFGVTSIGGDIYRGRHLSGDTYIGGDIYLGRHLSEATSIEGKIYRRRHLSGALTGVDVPWLQTESSQMFPTSPYAPSQPQVLLRRSRPVPQGTVPYSAWSSTPCGLLRYHRERSHLLPLMGSGPARPDRLRQSNNNNCIKYNKFCPDNRDTVNTTKILWCNRFQ